MLVDERNCVCVVTGDTIQGEVDLSVRHYVDFRYSKRKCCVRSRSKSAGLCFQLSPFASPASKVLAYHRYLSVVVC